MTAARFAAVLTLSVLGSGCVPFIVAESPTVTSVKVVDAESKRPLPNARLLVKGRPDTAVSADSEGMLNFEGIRDHKWLPAPPFDIVPAPLALVVEAPGYRPLQLPAERTGMVVAPIRNLVVELHRH